jgi:WD40 repeat protein/serine/threonine protein kinase/regulation of enolase protein 1 (concanavalin A-like superfamily)
MSEETLFAAALEQPPANRNAFLVEACGDNTALLARLRALLAAHGKDAGILDQPADPAEPSQEKTAKAPGWEQIGTLVASRYKLLEQIGEGGMGAVWVAEQTQPVRRKVALKLIKTGMDSKTVLSRFEAERQALALMDHPNIAKVLDGGTTEQGRPFFAMEYVRGVPITKYCDDNRLSVAERLALLVPVCQAVQHAHQKGIIHRDLKPSNILVCLYDSRPVAKVIDFGLAKAMHQPLTEHTLHTAHGLIIGTPLYMSPEQAELNNLDVDTRTDIYALGVILYELLTGTTPLEKKRFKEAAWHEMLRLIKEEEPPRPSERLSSSGSLPSLAAQRQLEPAKLMRLVRGELDWIVMKALEKDRARRYETANGFARDIQAYLADEPVEACPPSARYRLSKFARKHKKALVTTAAFAVLLLAGAVISTLLAVWAMSAERAANQHRIASDRAMQKAMDAKADADKQRAASDAAKQQAANAKVEADKQRDEARITAYAAGMGLAQRAWEENNVARAHELLEELPKEAAGRSLRGFEWHYLARLCRPDERTFVGNTGSVWSVSFSPDGQRLASGNADATVKIWDSVTGKELFVLNGHNAPVASVAFSPDGQRLVSGSQDSTVKIWDSVGGKQLFTLEGHSGTVSSVAFSPDSQRLASGSADSTVRIWDGVTGKQLFALKGHSGAINGVAFSPDGRRLTSGGEDHTVRIWDSVTGKELYRFNGHAKSVLSVAFSSTDQRLASGGWDGIVKVWNSVTGEELFTVKHAAQVSSVAFSPDGKRLASGSYDHAVKIWDSATGRELFALKGHAGWVHSVAFSPDGRRLASGSNDQTVKIWDNGTGTELFSFNGHSTGDGSQPVCLAFSPDGRRLASGSFHPTAKIWDSATGEELFALKGHASWVNGVAFSPDGGRLASASNDRTVRVWDSVTGKEQFALSGHTNGVWSVAFSPDGRRLASGSDDQAVKIWDSVTGQELLSLLAGGVRPSVAFSPDGRRLTSASNDGTMKIWDSVTGKELLSLKGLYAPVTGVAFSPDGRRLALASANQPVTICDSATGKALLSLKGHNALVTRVAFSPDGQRLASGSLDQTVKIWDSVTGKELLSLKSHGWVTSVAFSPDGQRLACANADGSINQWEGTTVSPEIQQRRATNQLLAVLFGQQGLRDDVLEQLRTLPGLSPARRQEAITLAQAYPEDQETLNHLAWKLVKLPGGELSGYRKALRCSEKACQLEPKNGLFLNTLGVAYFRVGNYEKALEVLLRSDRANKTQFQGSVPADLAFLAMTQRRLGHGKEAQAALQRLRERLKDPRWAPDAEALGFLHETEALLVPNLTAFLKGEYEPKDNFERLELIELCRVQRRPLAAARLFAAAFAAEPKLAADLSRQHRYNAAGLAALAANGQGEDAKELDDNERSHWRKQALAWLRADLAVYEKTLVSGPPNNQLIVGQRLERWQRDDDLIGLRDAKTLAGLPAEERQACQQLWVDVGALLKKVAALPLFSGAGKVNARKTGMPKADAGAWGTFEDPDEGCAFKLEGGALALTVPGSAHVLDIERGKMNAPRVLRPVEGDFIVQMKVGGKFDPRRPSTFTSAPYHGAGFFIRQDDNNYLRLERACFWNGREHVPYANFEVRANGRLDRFGTATVLTRLDNDKDAWLKLERRGNDFKAYASQQAGKWQELGMKTMTAPQRLEVGVAAINSALESFTPRFSGLELTAPPLEKSP